MSGGRMLVDSGTVVGLGDGWRGAVAVDGDGQAWLWLLAPVSGRQDHTGLPGCAAQCCAPHEQPGPLPRQLRVRVNQCQATASTTRRRCSNPAPPGESRCYAHPEST